MSDTPRTDGLTFLAQPGMMPPYNTVPAAFSRKLERELTEITEQRDWMIDAFKSIKKQIRKTARHDSTIERISIITETALAAVKGGEL